LHASKIAHKLTSKLDLIAVEVHHLLGKVPFVHYLLFTGLSELEIFLFHFVHFVSDSIDVVLDTAHLLVGVFEFLFHLFHLGCFLLQGLFVLDELVVDLGSGLTGQDVFELEEELFLFTDEVFFGLYFLGFGNEPSEIS
jgi:hypothetical protein